MDGYDLSCMFYHEAYINFALCERGREFQNTKLKKPNIDLNASLGKPND